MEPSSGTKEPGYDFGPIVPIEDIDALIEATPSVTLEEQMQAQKGMRLGRLLGHFRRDDLKEDVVGYPPISREDAKKYWAGNSQENIDGMHSYTQALLPNEEISLLSTEGSSAMVFQDKNDRAYKVMRDANHYTYYESEMRSLTLLHSEGLAPKPLLFIDARQDERRDPEERVQQPKFVDIAIPRHEGGGNLPIIVMGKVDFSELADVDLDTKITAFDRLYEFAHKHEILFGDVEPVIDKKTGQVIILDAGGMAKIKPGMREIKKIDGTVVGVRLEGASYEDYKKAEITSYLMQKFGVLPGLEQVAKLLQEGGDDAIHKYVADSLENPEPRNAERVI